VDDFDQMSVRLNESYQQLQEALADRERLNDERGALLADLDRKVRERTAELAILRVLGFQPRQLLALLAAEALTVSLAGAVFGCLLAGVAFALVRGYRIGGAMGVSIQVDALTAGVILSVAIGIALSSTLIPAYRASRMSIAEALRYVG